MAHKNSIRFNAQFHPWLKYIPTDFKSLSWEPSAFRLDLFSLFFFNNFSDRIGNICEIVLFFVYRNLLEGDFFSINQGFSDKVRVCSLNTYITMIL